MSENRIWQVGRAAVLRSYTDPRFKTMKVSVNMLLPLKQETAALYGILPSLVTRATREYPDFASLNRKLSKLYGASLRSGVRKIGEFQCLTLAADGISSRYAFGGDNMFAELSGLLFSALFSPLTDAAGLFPEENFRQEQRQLLELKDAEFSDKITYAHQRCEELLFAGQSAGVDRYGSKEEIAGLDRAKLTKAWNEVLSSARFEIFVLGDCEPSPELFQEKFSQVGMPHILRAAPFVRPQALKKEIETQAVTQSKLSMGFRADALPEESPLFQLMNAVFGGTPSSKLFQHVREKMGLCYYCSSLYAVSARALFVESGVETENLEQAEEEILQQLREMQEGHISEEELLSAKLRLCDSFRSVGDSLSAVETWNLGQTFSETPVTPEEAVKRVMGYSKEQVTEAAQKLVPAVVYHLKGSENG